MYKRQGKALADGLHRFRRAAAGVGKPQFAIFIGTVFCQAQLFCLHVLGLLAGDHLQKAKVINANICLLYTSLDNTLWGGIVGDDGVDGIAIGPEVPEGQVYAEFQSYCKALQLSLIHI